MTEFAMLFQSTKAVRPVYGSRGGAAVAALVAALCCVCAVISSCTAPAPPVAGPGGLDFRAPLPDPGGSGGAPFGVDLPPSAPPAVTLNGQSGVVVYQDWLVAGKVTSVRPGPALLWPTVVAGNGAAQVLVPTTAVPLAPQVEVRLFSRPIPATGVPVEAPRVLRCGSGQSPGPPAANPFTAACTLGESKDGLRWDLSRIPSDTTALMFSASWYVPMRARMDVPHSEPLDTVAVGWKIATHH